MEYRNENIVALMSFGKALIFICHTRPRWGKSGLIKTWFFFIFPDFFFLPDLKKKKKKIQIFFFFFFFFTNFFFFPILSRFSRFPSYVLYSSLFCPIFFRILSQFSYSKGGNVVRCHFSLRILFFFFYSRGAWSRGKQKTYFFFSAHYHPW